MCGFEAHSVTLYAICLHTPYEFYIYLNLETPVTQVSLFMYWGHAKKSYGLRATVGALCFLRFARCYISLHSLLTFVNVAIFTFDPLWHVLTRPQWVASELYSVAIITRIAVNKLARWLEWRDDHRWGKVNSSRGRWRRSMHGTCYRDHSIVILCLNGVVCVSAPPDSTGIARTPHFRRSDCDPSGRP